MGNGGVSVTRNATHEFVVVGLNTDSCATAGAPATSYKVNPVGCPQTATESGAVRVWAAPLGTDAFVAVAYIKQAVVTPWAGFGLPVTAGAGFAVLSAMTTDHAIVLDLSSL